MKYNPLLVLAGVALVVGLPLLAKWARGPAEPRCDLDGLAIEPLYRVRVVDAAGAAHHFCCVGCAKRWLERQTDRPSAIFVTDEASGGEIDARSAVFVRSLVMTNPVTRNYIHAFRDRPAAEEHVRAFMGAELTGDERPFASVIDSTRGRG